MSNITTAEQATAIIDSVAKVVDAANPDPVVAQGPGFWALCFIAILPFLAAGVYAWFKRHIIAGWFKDRKKP